MISSFLFLSGVIKSFWMNWSWISGSVCVTGCVCWRTSGEQSILHIPVVVVTGGSVGFSVFVFHHVLGELCAQRQFLPLLLAVVRLPRDLLRLGWTVDRLQLWSDGRGEEKELYDGTERFRLGWGGMMRIKWKMGGTQTVKGNEKEEKMDKSVCCYFRTQLLHY